jgi:hypothetical protein
MYNNSTIQRGKMDTTTGSRAVVQMQITCLACARPWIPSPNTAPQKYSYVGVMFLYFTGIVIPHPEAHVNIKMVNSRELTQKYTEKSLKKPQQ